MLLLVVLYILCIAFGMPFYVMGAAWPAVYGEIEVPDSWLGIISVIMICCSIIANIFAVNLLKRFSPGVILGASILMLGLALIGYGFSASFALLCVFAVPIGLAFGCFDVVLNDFIAVNYSSRHMNWIHCCWGLGATTGPLILSSGMERFGSWRPGYYSIGGIQIAMAIVLFLSLPLWKKAAKPVEQKTERLKTNFREAMRIKGVKLTLIALFFYCALEVTLGLWGSSYLVMVKNVSEERAAGWISLFFLGMTLGRLATGFLTIKLNNNQLIRFGGALIFVGLAILFLSAGEIAYMSGFFIFGFGCGPIWPCLVHETPKRFGESNSQHIVSLQIVSSNTGNAVAPLLFGFLTTFTGYGVLPLYLGVLLVVTMVTIEIQNGAENKITKKLVAKYGKSD